MTGTDDKQEVVRWYDTATDATSARPRLRGKTAKRSRSWPEQEEIDVIAFRHSVPRVEIPQRALPAERSMILEAFVRRLVSTGGNGGHTELFALDRNIATRRRLAHEYMKRQALRDT